MLMLDLQYTCRNRRHPGIPARLLTMCVQWLGGKGVPLESLDSPSVPYCTSLYSFFTTRAVQSSAEGVDVWTSVRPYCTLMQVRRLSLAGQPQVRAHSLANSVEAGFQLPFSLCAPGQVPSFTAQCVQDDVAVLVRTALMDSPKKTSRGVFWEREGGLVVTENEGCVAIVWRWQMDHGGHWMKPLGDCLLLKSTTLLERVSVALKWRKSNLAAYGIGLVLNKGRVEKVQMRGVGRGEVGQVSASWSFLTGRAGGMQRLCYTAASFIRRPGDDPRGLSFRWRWGDASNVDLLHTLRNSHGISSHRTFWDISIVKTVVQVGIFLSLHTETNSFLLHYMKARKFCPRLAVLPLPLLVTF